MKKMISVSFAVLAVTAAIVLAGCPAAVRPEPPLYIPGMVSTPLVAANINSIPGLQDAGGPTFTLVSVEGDFFELQITGRDTWHGLDVMHGQISPPAGATLRVTGRGDGTAMGAIALTTATATGATVFASQSLISGTDFTLTATPFNATARIVTTGGSSSNIMLRSVEVLSDGNVIWCMAEQLAQFIPDNGGGNGNNDNNNNNNNNNNNGPELVFDLADLLAGQTLGVVTSLPAPFAPSQNETGPVFTLIEEDGVRGIQVSGITNYGWHGINVTNAGAGFRVGDVITITGRVIAGGPVQMIANPNSVDWNLLANQNGVANGAEFNLAVTLTAPQVTSLQAACQHGASAGFRIRGHEFATMPGTFVITGFTLVGNR